MRYGEHIISTKSVKIFLFVEFGWPDSITDEIAQKSAILHKKISESDWIDDPVVAYGGIGSGKPCIWIFSLDGYDALDKLLHPTKSEGNNVAQAYNDFFSEMVNVESKVKHQVQFL